MKNLNVKIKEEPRVKTIYKATLCDVTKAREEYNALIDFLKLPVPQDENGRRRHWVEYCLLKHDFHKKAIVGIKEYTNLAPIAGRATIAQRLSNITTYTGIITHALLGDDTSVPADGDTTLGNETYRQAVTDQNAINNISLQSIFIPAGTATGSHKEAGLVVDGTASADTGQLFSHVNIDITKGAQNSLTFDVEITIS